MLIDKVMERAGPTLIALRAVQRAVLVQTAESMGYAPSQITEMIGVSDGK